MLERNRNSIVSKDDIDRLEAKIKGLEKQILNNKVDKKLNVLESELNSSKILSHASQDKISLRKEPEDNILSANEESDIVKKLAHLTETDLKP